MSIGNSLKSLFKSAAFNKAKKVSLLTLGSATVVFACISAYREIEACKALKANPQEMQAAKYMLETEGRNPTVYYRNPLFGSHWKTHGECDITGP